MRGIDELLIEISRCKFRSRFRLGAKERAYLGSKGLETIMRHARQFIELRLASASPINDGKQTPMRNHPVFISQHATATCCRGCLEKWHDIPRGAPLTAEQTEYILQVIQAWLLRQGRARQQGS